LRRKKEKKNVDVGLEVVEEPSLTQVVEVVSSASAMAALATASVAPASA